MGKHEDFVTWVSTWIVPFWVGLAIGICTTFALWAFSVYQEEKTNGEIYYHKVYSDLREHIVIDGWTVKYHLEER